ncbi:MAG TPA: glycosyltransferase family 2 protein [Chitinophagaceae bacterium]|nr:glycosyltransferase family 2 protein [Chitinophagaceae bacterium]
MDLSIIIINYKSANHVLACIQSICNETQKYSFEIIVVDNDSGDESESKIQKAFPEVIWIQSGYNAGFARANNIGMRASKGDHILVLNADTIVLENALDKTIDLFKSKPDAVACGVQLLNPDGTHQISGAYFKKGGLNVLLPLPYLGRFIRYMGYKMKTKIPSVKEVVAVQEVDWIVGAFIMVKKEVLERSGLMDEDFFMYAEEIEWCSRLRKQGKLYLFEEPKVIHIGGGTSSDYYNTDNDNSNNLWSKKARQIIISRLLQIRKQFGVLYYLLIVFFFIIEIPIFFIGLLLEKIARGSKAKYTWENVSGYITNVGYIIKYFFRILANKPFFYKVY